MKRSAVFLASIAFAFAGSLLFSNPALAHDEVVSTSPTAGETVQAGLINVAVEFGEEIMQMGDNAGIDIQVKNASGSILPQVTCLQIETTTMAAGYAFDEPGEYTVAWRSVSVDGHANSETFTFSVENNTNYVAPTDFECPLLGAVLDTPAPGVNPDEGGAEPQVWQAAILGIIAAAAVVVAGVVVVRRRKSSAKN